MLDFSNKTAYLKKKEKKEGTSNLATNILRRMFFDQNHGHNLTFPP